MQKTTFKRIIHRVATKPGYRIVAAALIVAAICTISRQDSTPFAKTVSIFRPLNLSQHILTLDGLREARIYRYFQGMKSPQPVAMTAAVMSTTRPVVLAPISKRESRGNPKAVGDHGKSRGAFQVQARHWGRVPSHKRPDLQAQQADRILSDLLTPGDCMMDSVRKYNGSGPAARNYAKNITREALELELVN